MRKALKAWKRLTEVYTKFWQFFGMPSKKRQFIKRLNDLKKRNK